MTTTAGGSHLKDYHTIMLSNSYNFIASLKCIQRNKQVKIKLKVWRRHGCERTFAFLVTCDTEVEILLMEGHFGVGCKGQHDVSLTSGL
jgi:hypothetical protein